MPEKPSIRLMSKVICIGDACVDIISKKGSKNNAEFLCGGAGANSAYGLGKLNVDTAMIAMAGKDIYGEGMKKALEDANVKTDLFFLKEKESTKVLIEINENNDRFPKLLTNIKPSYLQISKEHLSQINLNDCEYILTNGMMLFDNPAAETISDFLSKVHRLGIKILLDINYRIEAINKDRKYIDKVINVSNFILGSLNDEILPVSYSNNLDEAIGKLVNKDRMIIVRNQKGADIYSENNHFHCDSFKVEVADTTGAGDAYNAGFIYGLVNHYDLAICNKMGCACAAINIKKTGARNMPSEKELLNFMFEYQQMI